MSSILISQDWLSTRVVFYQRKHLFCRPSCRLRQRRATSSSPPPPLHTPRTAPSVSARLLPAARPVSSAVVPLPAVVVFTTGTDAIKRTKNFRRRPETPADASSSAVRQILAALSGSSACRMLSILNECSLRILGNGHWTFQSAGSIFETGTLSFMSAPFLALLSTKFKSETGRNCAIEASI